MDSSASPNRPSHGVFSDLESSTSGGKRGASTEAEPDDADVVVGDAGLVQVGASGVDVGEQSVVGESFEQGQHLAEVVVGRGATARSMEDVDPEPDVSGIRDAFRD